MEDLKDFNDLTALLDRHDSIHKVKERKKGEEGAGGTGRVEMSDVRVYLDDSLSFSKSRYSIEYVDIPYAPEMDVRMLRYCY